MSLCYYRQTCVYLGESCGGKRCSEVLCCEGLVASYPVLRLSVLWLGVAGLAVLRGGIGGGGGVAGEGVELSGVWVKLREGWVEARLEVRGQTEDMVVTDVLLRLVTACDIWLDICQRGKRGQRRVYYRRLR